MQVSANDQPVELTEKGFGTFTDCEGNKMGVYFERKLVRPITAADIAKAQTTEAVPA